jgi:CrcB protein
MLGGPYDGKRKMEEKGRKGMKLLMIALGGAAGASLRYWFGARLARHTFVLAIPFAMIIANGIGSFGLGIATALAEHGPVSPAVTAGFFGAFTTFSTFSLEAVQLVENKQYAQAFFYIAFSSVGSIALFALGYYLLRWGLAIIA